MTDLLELLINWHMNEQFSASLFKRLIDQKYTLLPEILKSLANLNLKADSQSRFLSFILCILSNKQVRSIVYRSKILQEYSEVFSKSSSD